LLLSGFASEFNNPSEHLAIQKACSHRCRHPTGLLPIEIDTDYIRLHYSRNFIVSAFVYLIYSSLKLSSILSTA